MRELRQHASRYLEKVKAGEVVEVTERGKLIALLVSPSPAIAVRDQLIASGRLEPAKNAFQLPQRRQVGPDGTTGSSALADPRQERHT